MGDRGPHIQAAYDEARKALATWKRDDLVTAIVEDDVQMYIASEQFNGQVGKYSDARYAYWNQSVAGFGPLYSQAMLAERVWMIAKEQQTCSQDRD